MSSAKTKVCVTFALIGFAVVAAGVAWGANLLEKPKDTVAPTAPVVSTRATLPLQDQGASDKKVTLLPIQLKNGGFVPREITQPLGNYELLINNVSHELEGSLLLERENGKRVETLTLVKGRNLRKLIRLTPGNYVLRVANQPTWTTSITITSH